MMNREKDRLKAIDSDDMIDKNSFLSTFCKMDLIYTALGTDVCNPEIRRYIVQGGLRGCSEWGREPTSELIELANIYVEEGIMGLQRHII